MKAIILTLALVGLVSTINVNKINANNKEGIYISEINDSVTNTKTRILSKGKDEKFLKLEAKYVLKYDDHGNIIEKITYRWDEYSCQWLAKKRYTYLYDANAALHTLAYNEWNDISESWKSDTKYTMYLYNTNGELLTENN